jgi:hypothetical protein
MRALAERFQVDYSCPYTSEQQQIVNTAMSIGCMPNPFHPEDQAEIQVCLRKLLEALDALKRVR